VDGKLIPAGWRSVGARQRVHEVQEVPGEGLLVRLVVSGAPCESDAYAHNAICGARAAGAPAPGVPRSGAVLRGAGRGTALHSSRGADGFAPV
jgi:hypothetical protein